MDILRQEIQTLTAKLASSDPDPDSVEHTALAYLRKLDAAARQTREARILAPLIGPLHQFWLESVPWCSPLSKDIERILTIQEELSSNE